MTAYRNLIMRSSPSEIEQQREYLSTIRTMRLLAQEDQAQLRQAPRDSFQSLAADLESHAEHRNMRPGMGRRSGRSDPSLNSGNPSSRL